MSEKYTDPNQIVFRQDDPPEGGNARPTNSAIAERWSNIKKEDLSDEDKEKVRQEYLALIEDIYQEMVSKQGEIKSGSLQDCLNARIGLGELFASHPEYERSAIHYDLGYRLLIDLVINSDDCIGSEEKSALSEYFMSLSPYYHYKDIKGKSAHPLSDFVVNYPNKERLHKSLEYLFKKCRKIRFIANPTDLVGYVGQERRGAYNSWANSFPERYSQAKTKADLAGDSMANPDFNYDLVKMIEILNGKQEEEIEFFNSEVKKRLEGEAEEEFLQQAESEFGSGFRPPEILKEEYK